MPHVWKDEYLPPGGAAPASGLYCWPFLSAGHLLDLMSFLAPVLPATNSPSSWENEVLLWVQKSKSPGQPKAAKPPMCQNRVMLPTESSSIHFSVSRFSWLQLRSNPVVLQEARCQYSPVSPPWPSSLFSFSLWLQHDSLLLFLYYF